MISEYFDREYIVKLRNFLGERPLRELHDAVEVYRQVRENGKIIPFRNQIISDREYQEYLATINFRKNYGDNMKSPKSPRLEVVLN